MSEVAIIDSGGANIASVLYAFERLGASAELTTDPATIRSAPRVLLPGVGAARDAMTRLRAAGLVDVIRELEQPVLGICLGMQLLCETSAEDATDCLGIIPGQVTKLKASTDRTVPNMGWCATRVVQAHPLLTGIENDSFFYYLHSYALPTGAYTLATAEHADAFSAVIARDNFMGAQFHPERSSQTGAQLLRNFLEFPA